MAPGEERSPSNGGNNGSGNGPPTREQVLEISEVQAAYILDNFPDAAVYPPRDGDQNQDEVEFIYRRRTLLTRDRDLQRVLAILNPPRLIAAGDEAGPAQAGEVSHPIPGLALVELLGGDDDPVAEALILFGALDIIEQQLGAGIAGPDHIMSVSPATHCAATEPYWVPGDTAPQPGVSRSRCNGHGTLVAVVDTGLVEGAPAMHPWMNGVTGEPDPEVTREPDGRLGIVPYDGHGTFVAGLVRTTAPRADVRVKRIFQRAGALYESEVVRALLPVLDWAPDVINLSAGTHTWKHHGLLSFHVFVDGPLRECEGTVLVAAAGNDGLDWKFSPAEMKGVIGVGSLGPPGDARAWFSDYGEWVDVFAPGQGLVNAFAHGLYRYRELLAPQEAEFFGMAQWSGTSFSAPLVSGLIAARMSGTGQSAREAAESLLQLARAQALPGVGPVLHPGQACLTVGEQPCRHDSGRGGCGCHS
jgi:subtilisin family serine protease